MKFIGPNLFHNICNDNGEELKNLIHAGQYHVKSSWCKTPSLRTTWSNHKSESQIDHILCNTRRILFRNMFGTIVNTVQTDHKILSAEIFLPNQPTSPFKRQRTTSIEHITKHRKLNSGKQWNVRLLQEQTNRDRYRTELSISAKALRATIQETYDSRLPPSLWPKIAKIIKQTAINTIPNEREPLSPKRMKARSEYLIERSRLTKDPSNVTLQARTQHAKQTFNELQQQHLDLQYNKFLNDVTNVHPQKRLSSTYKFIKQFRQRKNNSLTQHIPISHWANLLKESCNGSPSTLMSEPTHIPIGPPPTIEDIENITQQMHNGTAPGIDKINIELIKNAPSELLELIHQIIVNTRNSNVVPNEWIQTKQVPIPRNNKPKTVDDFRRITLSSTVYKIYATFLLRRLQQYVPEIPLYQAGFLKNRSTDDHIFTLRRIAEERWRKGLPTVLLSIDLRKAFDMVDTHKIGEILMHFGTPVYLVNRIIKAILCERTSIHCDGRRTLQCSKNRGVKQGCPISPYIFVIVMHYALQRACNRLNIDMNLTSFNLPLILAYADDIIILADSTSSLEPILIEFERELLCLGLSINENKSSILIRDPLHVLPPVEESIQLNNKTYKIVTILKYLGIYISTDLDRRSTVSHRTKLAYRHLHMLLPFFETNRLPFATLLRLYHSVIVPTVTYGLKVATITKRNIQSLMNMEHSIVLRLRDLSRDRPQENNVERLLQGRTIDRVCRVLRLKYWGHIMRRPAHHVLQNAYYYSIPGKKKIGRPCYTWHTSLQRAIRRSKINDWHNTIQNTHAHNQKCNSLFDPSGTDDSD